MDAYETSHLTHLPPAIDWGRKAPENTGCGSIDVGRERREGLWSYHPPTPPFLHTINIIIVAVAGYGSIHGGIVIVSSSCQRGAEIIGLIDPRLIRAFAGQQIMVLENARKVSNPFVSFLWPPPLCGGFWCWADRPCALLWGGGTTLTKSVERARKQGSWLLSGSGGRENKDALAADKIPKIIICSKDEQNLTTGVQVFATALQSFYSHDHL